MALSMLIGSIAGAWALECQEGIQGGDSHWAWRLIEGRKCWYKGAPGMDKSLLHWSHADDTSARPARTAQPLERPEFANAQAVPQLQSIPPEMLRMLPIMPPQPTFEDRWRLR